MMNFCITRLPVLAELFAIIVCNPCSASDKDLSVPITGTVVVVNQASDTITLVNLATMEAY